MLSKPPCGKVATYIAGLVGLIAWEPGNATRYVMQSTFLPDRIAALLGGTVLVSFGNGCDRFFRSHAVNPGSTGHWEVDYVTEHWGFENEIGDDPEYFTMLLNWVLGGSRAKAYADDLWRQVTGAGGEVVQLHERIVRRRQGSDA